MKKKRLSFLTLSLLGVVSLFGQTIRPLAELPSGLEFDPSYALMYNMRFKDSLGNHALVLLRSQRRSEEGAETIVLKAMQFRQDSTSWVGEWEIKDWVDCEGLDIAGDFDVGLTAISDLDSNGIMETTIAYKLVCAGGVEPKTTKVVMRQGKMKYAVRGESMVKIGENSSYGGTYSADPILDEKPEFRRFLVEKWKASANY